MYVGRDFSPSDVGENEIYSLDFVNDLQSGETITAVTFTMTVAQGVDATPSARLNGSPGWTGTRTMQRCSGMLGGVTYTLQAVVTTSLGNTLSLFSHIRSQTTF